MEPGLAIRPAILPHDYPAIAAVLAAESPEWAADADELAYQDRSRDPRDHHATLVAESPEGGAASLAGVAFVGRDTRLPAEGKFEMNLRVRPDWQGRGVGEALYQAVLEHLAPFSPRELCADYWGAHPRAGRFLAERGFAEVSRRIDGRLETANFDFAPYAGLEERLQAQGIRVMTYAELAGDPRRLAKLHQLDEAAWQDVPFFGERTAARSLERFAAEEVDRPDYLADACFIAVRGADFVGYSNLVESDAGFSVDMTGVLRPYRRMGVATVLKLRGIRHAQSHGNQPVWTVNDSANAAILRLNEKLGFQRAGEIIRVAKRFQA
jgi:GNAT superfamily N-acetyltransferase